MKKLILATCLLMGISSVQVSSSIERERPVPIKSKETIEIKDKKPVGYHFENIGEPSNIEEHELKEVLENAPNDNLAKYAKDIVKAEKFYSVNAFALSAIIAQESGWGRSHRAKTQNNLTGYAVYNSNASGKDFDSAGDSILATAKLLKENYLTPEAENFNGTSITGVNIDYCLTEDSSRTDYNWSKDIHSIAIGLEEIYYERN